MDSFVFKRKCKVSRQGRYRPGGFTVSYHRVSIFGVGGSPLANFTGRQEGLNGVTSEFYGQPFVTNPVITHRELPFEALLSCSRKIFRLEIGNCS